jgi:hypothetical protein
MFGASAAFLSPHEDGWSQAIGVAESDLSIRIREVHPVAPSPAEHNAGTGEVMSSELDAGNSPVVDTGATNIVDFNAGMARALRESFGGLSVKEVARLVGRSPRTVEDWFAGRHCPHPFDLRKLALAMPKFSMWAGKLLGIEADVLRARELEIELQRFHEVTARLIEGAKQR